MKVALDATALNSGRGGDETLLRGVLSGLATILDDRSDAEFALYTRPGAILPPNVASSPYFSKREMVWGPAPVRYAVRLPQLVETEHRSPDLLYTQTHAPFVPPVPLVLQLTDLSFYHHPRMYPLLTRLRLNLLVPLHARLARVVLVISEFSRRDVLATYGLSPERVFVVPCGVESRVAPRPSGVVAEAAWLSNLGIVGPFFLYVGNLHPRKNVPRLIHAFNRAQRANVAVSQHQLVIVGARWWDGSDEERAAAAAAPGSIIFAGRLPDADRDRLLRSAAALVYPALFEGFGLPPLEAMAAGTPVLASNTSALPEVLGDAALLVDPLDVDALASGLTMMATDEPLRRELSRRGRVRAKRYSVRETGLRTLEALRAAMEMPGGVSGAGLRTAMARIRRTQHATSVLSAGARTSQSTGRTG